MTCPGSLDLLEAKLVIGLLHNGSYSTHPLRNPTARWDGKMNRATTQPGYLGVSGVH